MAKFVKTYENNTEKLELTFCGVTYDYTMSECDGGRKGNKPCFDTQISKAVPEINDDDKLLDLLSQLSFEDSGNELVDIIEQLSDAEEWYAK